MPLRSYNPLRMALHGWLTLAPDLRRAQSPRDVLHIRFGLPDLSPLSNSRSPA